MNFGKRLFGHAGFSRLGEMPPHPNPPPRSTGGEGPGKSIAIALWLTAVVGISISGCSESLSPPKRSGEPIGVQFIKTDSTFIGVPFRVLLDFESAGDLAFIGSGSATILDPAVSHTGNVSLQVPGHTGGFTVKLNALLGAGDFPGQWTLAGGYFISRENSTVQVSYEVDGKVILSRTVALSGRRWTPVMLDLTPLSDPNANASREVGILRFKTDSSTVWCDDVLAIDNVKSLVPESENAGDAWTIRRRGFATLIEKPGSFKLRVPTPEAEPEGWRVEESNELRVRLLSANGKHAWTIYCDGRGYRDGRFEPVMELSTAEQVMLGEQQTSPAEISVAEEWGRIERNAPGDQNNDGYEETTGTYQLKANGSKIEATITPRTARLVRPVLEISGLPPGRVVVNLEGRYVEKSVRLTNGHVLVEIPGTIQHPVMVNVRVR